MIEISISCHEPGSSPINFLQVDFVFLQILFGTSVLKGRIYYGVVIIAVCLKCFGNYFRFCLRKFDVLLAVLGILPTWVLQLRLLLMVFLMYLE